MDYNGNKGFRLLTMYERLNKGENIDSVLDRLPTAEILNKKDGVYTIRAETYGDGIYMWLRSQGDKVKVIE